MRLQMSAFGLLLLALVLAAPASASMIIDRDATGIRLTVDDRGRALVTYKVRGKVRHVIASGAVNADVRFKLDYSGGRGVGWKSITACPAYDGPALGWFVAACKASDGSYWALQRWQRGLRNQGYAPATSLQRAWELHLSHWTGPLPQLDLYVDWVFRGKYHHLFGRYTYLGKAVHGHKTTNTGVPLDPFGRNVYLDVYGSVYGQKWVRENSFLAHKPTGTFCYGFYPRASYYDKTTRPAGHGERYRATAVGPGVSPDPVWEHAGLGQFDAVHESNMNAFQDTLMSGDKLCRQH